ncbi:DUF3153 domain-containing protein [Isoptericola sp. NEAU-Y5]|uniref:DUF3153 domain-containing protein n=1 Tax=Isoptericola luteus TaxID=2879484 RepID=A0ABS7ZAD8_9MICO|nr:DUF3153 domain-containing protein [Isoptericola sp. NEAU-Y5]MCA5892021.1 DUF3153 domain-containing protein [Isoptericola sp. NEAU-Y5]
MNTITRPRRRLRTALAALLATVGLLALAGCMKVDMDMTLSSDDTVSGSVVMAVSNRLAESMDMEPGELWQQGSGELGSDLPEGATQEPYADDEYTGTKYTFTDAPLDQFGADDSETLSITRDGDDFVVAGTMDMSDTSQLESLPEGVRDAFDMRIAITFPGAVDADATNGAIEGTTVTWAPKIGEANELKARGSAVAGNDFPWWLVGLVIGILVIALVVVLVVRSQRSGSSAAVSGQPMGAPVADPGTVPGTGTGPTPEEQVFGTRPAAAPVPAEPTAAAPAPASQSATGPTPEPFEPKGDSEPESGPDAGRRPTDPPHGA